MSNDQRYFMVDNCYDEQLHAHAKQLGILTSHCLTLSNPHSKRIPVIYNRGRVRAGYKSLVSGNAVIEMLRLKYCVIYLLLLYQGFYSYTEGATWKILDNFTGLRGSSLRFSPIDLTTQPGDPRQRYLNEHPPHLNFNDGFPVIQLGQQRKVA